MKNFFKKAFVCAGIMASALALNSIATFAEVYSTPTGKVVWNGDEALDIGGAKVYEAAGLKSDEAVSGTYWGITFTNVLTNKSNNRVDLYNSKVSGNNPSNIVITPSIDSKLSVTIANKSLEISDGSETTTYAAGDREIILNAGITYTLNNAASSGSGRCYLKDMKLTSASAPTYTAKLNLTNNSSTDAVVTLNNESVTVSANGTNVLEVSGLSGNSDYIISTDSTHVLDKTTVNLSADTEYDVTVSGIPNIEEGNYGADAQIASNGFITDITSNKYSQNNYFGFTLSNAATVTLSAQCGSNATSTDTKSAKLILANNYSAVSGKDILSVGTSSSGLDYSVEKSIDLLAGTYYFIAVSPAIDGQDTTSVQVTNVNIAYSTNVSEAYEAASTVNGNIDTTAASGVGVSAKYVYANNKAYFVLDFDLTNVAENVTGLKYQGNDVTLYKKIQFSDENDIITADENHALYGFIVTDGTDKGVASVNATVTAVTE